MSNTENRYTETDLGNVAPNPRGEYDPAEAYEYLDLVEYGGGSYLCVQEAGTVTGIAPAQGKNTEVWQVLTIPGDLTPGYIAIHDDVVNKAESAQADAASTAADREQVESMLANVEQLHTQTETAAQEASDSRDSAAGYATAAEASRTAAAESEKNAQLQVTGFDETVNAAKQEATEEIATARKTAVQAVAAQQVKSVNAVNAAGSAAIEKTSADAKEAKDAKEAAVSAANAAEGNAREATAAAEQAKNDKQSAETAAAAANSSAAAAKTAQKAVEGAAEQIETNKTDITALKEDLGDLSENKISKFYVSNQGEIHLADSDNGKIMDMMLYGKSSQDGTPTPDNPVEIKNVVNPTVKVCGKNLWNPIAGGYISGNDGSIAEGKKKYLAVTDFIKINGKDITVIARNFSSAMEIGYAYRIGFYNAEKKWIKNINLSNGDKHSINTFNVTGTEYIRVSAPAGIYDSIQIEYGSEATSYEPYHEQTVQLPYTLNAIPVASGGNVTIDGQQYIADYVDVEREKLVRMVDSSKLDNTQSIVNKTEWLLAEPQETNLTTGEITAFKVLATYYPTTNISVNSEQLDGYTVFNYPVSMQNGWNYVKQQLNDNRDYIYDMDTQSAEAYVNSEYAVTLTELEV